MKVAIAQIPIRMGNKRENVKNTIKALEEAGDMGSDLCILPECCISGWLSPKARAHAESLSGETISKWRTFSKRFSMNMVAGFEELFQGKVYNSAILMDRKGEIVSVHRKINELDLARCIYSCGTSLNLTQIDGVPVGVNICADNWTSDAAAVLFSMGAKVLISPCAWAVERGKEIENLNWIRSRYRAVIRKAPLFVLTANGVGEVTEGPWKGKILQGNSLAFDPKGKTLFQAGTDKGVHFLEIPVGKSAASEGRAGSPLHAATMAQKNTPPISGSYSF